MEGRGRLREVCVRWMDALDELDFHIRPEGPIKSCGSFYVVDTLGTARWAAEQKDYEKAVRVGRNRKGHQYHVSSILLRVLPEESLGFASGSRECLFAGAPACAGRT